MKKGILIYIVLLLLLLPALSYSADQYTFSRKDPILAGALSWYVPGLGQIYSGAFLKGVAFFVVEEALLIGTVLTFAELKLDVTGSIDIGLNIKSKESPGRKEQRKGIILGVSFIIIHFVDVIDAVNTTRKYNRSFKKNFYTDVGYNADDKTYTLEFNQRF